MHAGDDDDDVAIDPVEQAVGEALRNEGASGSAVQDGISLRVFDDAIPCCVERHEELFAQAGPLRFVPLIGVVDVGGSRRPDNDPLHRPRL